MKMLIYFLSAGLVLVSALALLWYLRHRDVGYLLIAVITMIAGVFALLLLSWLPLAVGGILALIVFAGIAGSIS